MYRDLFPSTNSHPLVHREINHLSLIAVRSILSLSLSPSKKLAPSLHHHLVWMVGWLVGSFAPRPIPIPRRTYILLGERQHQQRTKRSTPLFFSSCYCYCYCYYYFWLVCFERGVGSVGRWVDSHIRSFVYLSSNVSYRIVSCDVQLFVFFFDQKKISCVIVEEEYGVEGERKGGLRCPD